ncbi:FecR family protein [Agriterribacter sp.]|uniref:FecR family protein n=1 Tax=Agriterribacter sp. TaxID=2821509 RepID=UPI002BBF8D49|nr:FecR family protein [Agriterribacter sp.]HRP55476.1 FecR family protein [Agriterribacter sp.]
MTVDRIWLILGKKLSGEASPGELEELEKMLRHHPNLHYPIQNITDLWRLKKPINRAEALASLQKHLLRLGEAEAPAASAAEAAFPRNAESHIIKKRSRSFIGVAAFGALALLLSYAVYYFGKAETLKKNEIATRAGAHSKIILPDGSTVWLNAGSRLIYNKNFDAAIREVELIGEAYFDVKKDTTRPFIIHAQKMNIRVLGTAFNVKSYPGDKNSETSLIRGLIEVTIDDRPNEKIILHPAEKLVVMNDGQTKNEADGKIAGIPSPVVISKINYAPADSAVIETSWIDNRLIFRNKIFSELVVELERKYGMAFRFKDESAKQLMFDVNFKNETIHQVLQALQLANPFNYSIEKETIVISK